MQKFSEMATKGGSKLQMYPVMLGAAGTNSARQIAEHSAAGCVYVQLEGVKVQTGSRRAAGGVLGAAKHTSAGVDVAELDKHLTKHGITRLAAKPNNISEECTVLTECDACPATCGAHGSCDGAHACECECGWLGLACEVRSPNAGEAQRAHRSSPAHSNRTRLATDIDRHTPAFTAR